MGAYLELFWLFLGGMARSNYKSETRQINEKLEWYCPDFPRWIYDFIYYGWFDRPRFTEQLCNFYQWRDLKSKQRTVEEMQRKK